MERASLNFITPHFPFVKEKCRATQGFGVCVGACRGVWVCHICSKHWAGPTGESGTCRAGKSRWDQGRGAGWTEGSCWYSENVCVPVNQESDVCVPALVTFSPCQLRRRHGHLCLCSMGVLLGGCCWRQHLAWQSVWPVVSVTVCMSVCVSMTSTSVCLWDKCSALLLVETSTSSLHLLDWGRAKMNLKASIRI